MSSLPLATRPALSNGSSAHSSVAMNLVPIRTPSAPSASAAASPAPSASPPAASTGTGATAFTTCRTRTVVPISPTWPPPSVPCATTTSAPASTAATASGSVVTMCITFAPRS